MPVHQSQTTDLFTQVRYEVDAFLAGFFETQITRAMVLDTTYAELWRSIKTVALAGGKRLRPYMTVLAYESFGGTERTNVIPAASAQELLHFSMLIHDDIIDEDYTRHDTDNIAGMYLKRYARYLDNEADRYHFANSAALVGGDLVLSAAYQAIYTSRLAPTQRELATDILNDAIFIVCGGELLDTEASFKPAHELDALKIAQLKTASYSFVSPLIMGASLAGASEASLTQLREFGTNLGIAFQLADDILGLYGDEKITGKSNSSDLRQGKRNHLMLLALERAGNQRTILEALIGKKDLNGDELETAKHIIEDCGAKRATEALIHEYAELATSTLSTLDITNPHRVEYAALIQKATQRNQ